MKRSPLCVRDEGREIFFTARTEAGKFRVTVPRELLDDTCGDSTGEAGRKSWVNANITDILARLEGTATHAPFNRIRVEEIS